MKQNGDFFFITYEMYMYSEQILKAKCESGCHVVSVYIRRYIFILEKPNRKDRIKDLLSVRYLLFLYLIYYQKMKETIPETLNVY